MINLTDGLPSLSERRRLSKEEWKRFQKSERIIQSGLRTFLRIGEALAIVRRNKFYRQNHRTFELYCKERWNFTDRHALNLIRAWETSEAFPRSLPLPAHESQFRALGKLPMRLREDAWARALSFAGSPKKVTTKHVQAVVKVIRTRRKLSAYDKDTPILP